MKPMVLTALGSENNFATGGTSYFLVFNDGDLRVPISEDAAEAVIAKMYSQQIETETPTEMTSTENHTLTPGGTTDDDDGVDQV